MIKDHDFQTHVAYDDSGLVVTITHEPTGLKREGRLEFADDPYYLSNQFRREITSEIYKMARIRDDSEFTIDTIRCEISGKIRSIYGVTHQPTGKVQRQKDDAPFSRENILDLMDAIMTELWNEKNK